ncbi:hypothetical protein QJQ45_023425 [Haematococcus lacustris]|nr:hypothetical protein QJQ45_023425 [Haematococcus lacustris]
MGVANNPDGQVQEDDVELNTLFSVNQLSPAVTHLSRGQLEQRYLELLCDHQQSTERFAYTLRQLRQQHRQELEKLQTELDAAHEQLHSWHTEEAGSTASSQCKDEVQLPGADPGTPLLLDACNSPHGSQQGNTGGSVLVNQMSHLLTAASRLCSKASLQVQMVLRLGQHAESSGSSLQSQAQGAHPPPLQASSVQATVPQPAAAVMGPASSGGWTTPMPQHACISSSSFSSPTSSLCGTATGVQCEPSMPMPTPQAAVGATGQPAASNISLTRLSDSRTQGLTHVAQPSPNAGLLPTFPLLTPNDVSSQALLTPTAALPSWSVASAVDTPTLLEAMQSASCKADGVALVEGHHDQGCQGVGCEAEDSTGHPGDVGKQAFESQDGLLQLCSHWVAAEQRHQASLQEHHHEMLMRTQQLHKWVCSQRNSCMRVLPCAALWPDVTAWHDVHWGLPWGLQWKLL